MAVHEGRATQLAAALAGVQEAAESAKVGADSSAGLSVWITNRNQVRWILKLSCQAPNTPPLSLSLPLQAEHTAALGAKTAALATAEEEKVRGRRTLSDTARAAEEGACMADLGAFSLNLQPTCLALYPRHYPHVGQPANRAGRQVHPAGEADRPVQRTAGGGWGHAGGCTGGNAGRQLSACLCTNMQSLALLCWLTTLAQSVVMNMSLPARSMRTLPPGCQGQRADEAADAAGGGHPAPQPGGEAAAGEAGA